MIERGEQQGGIAKDDRFVVEQADFGEGVRRIDRRAPGYRR
jgi:hypothetical protein